MKHYQLVFDLGSQYISAGLRQDGFFDKIPTIVAHGGADGKMVKDFISCIAENRKPDLDVDFAIQMSIPGIIAHQSAVQGGMPVEIPQF